MSLLVHRWHERLLGLVYAWHVERRCVSSHLLWLIHAWHVSWLALLLHLLLLLVEAGYIGAGWRRVWAGYVGTL